MGLFIVIFSTARYQGSSSNCSQEILHFLFFSIVNWHYKYFRGVDRFFFFAGGCDPTRRRTKRAPEVRASRGVRVHAPPRKFWKLGCLRLNLVRFEGSMIWKRQPIANLKKWILLKLFNFKMIFFLKIRITIHTANHHDLSVAYQTKAS